MHAFFNLASPPTHVLDLAGGPWQTLGCFFDQGDWELGAGQLECLEALSPGHRSLVVAGLPFSVVELRLVGTQVRSLGVNDIALGEFTQGTLIVQGPASSLVNDNPDLGYWLAVGSRGQGRLEVLDGATVLTGVNGTTIGDFFDGTGGTLVVRGAGSSLTTQAMSVAKRAPGQLLVDQGGDVQIDHWLVVSDIPNPNDPGAPAADAELLVHDPGSILRSGLNGDGTWLGPNGHAQVEVLNGATLEAYGPIHLGDPGGAATGLGSCDAVLEGGGTLLVSTDLNPWGGLHLHWGAQLVVRAGAEARGDNWVWINDGGRVLLDGGTLAAPTVQLTPAATVGLAGAGTVAGNLWSDAVVHNSAPDDGIAVTGNLLQGATGVLDVSIFGTGLGVGHGQVSVVGGASIAGTLRLSFEAGYVPDADDVFPVLSATSIVGEFSALEVEGASNRSFELQYIGGTVIVKCLGEAITSYCECVNAPTCGNDSLDSGCTNSTGLGGVLGAVGAPAVHLAGTPQALGFELTQAPPLQFGILFMGPTTGAGPLGDGELCVGSGGVGLFRFPVQQTNNSGTAVWSDVIGHAQINFPPQAQPQVGETWYFQAWYRDPGGPCGLGSNTSQGQAVLFSQ